MTSPVDGIFLELVDELQQLVPLDQLPVAIQEKGHLDYVTALDVALDAAVSALIARLFPDDVVISEEAWREEQGLGQRFWVVDPLDGTSNAISGLPFFAISAALIDDGGVRFGLVFDYLHNEMFYAERARGAFLNGEPLVRANNPASFFGISTGFLQAYSKLCQPLAEEVKFRLLGSQALHLCYVASGRFRGAVNLESKLWDDLAGALIVREAGGCFVSLAGLDLDKPSSWNGHVTSSALALVDPADDLADIFTGLKL